MLTFARLEKRQIKTDAKYIRENAHHVDII